MITDGETTPRETDRATRRRTLKMLLLMTGVALAVRLMVLVVLYGGSSPTRFDALTHVETFRVAQSVAAGNGISSPFAATTGPTAFLSPVYPLLAGGLFKLFAGKPAAGILAVLAMNCVASALACVTIFFLARRLLGEKTASAAGWTWTIFPYAVYMPVTQFWDTDFAPLLVTSLLLLTLRLADAPSPVRWMAFGAGWGLTALTTSALLLILPVTGLWAALQMRRAGRPWFTGAVTASIVFALVVSPWFLRNAQRFHEFVPFRSNLPLELTVGNSLETDVRWRGWLHPNENRGELQEYKRLGESAYMAKKQAAFRRFVASHPGVFAWLSAKRMAYVWTGIWDLRPRFLWAWPLEAINIPLAVLLTVCGFLGLRSLLRENAAAGWLFLLALVFLPAVFYFTHASLRYRHSLDALLVILAVHTALHSQRSPNLAARVWSAFRHRGKPPAAVAA